MTKFKQWRIRSGATVIYGAGRSQNLGLEGGQIQKFILDKVKDLLEQ